MNLQSSHNKAPNQPVHPYSLNKQHIFPFLYRFSGQFFVFFFFYFVVAIFDLVHDVEAIYGLC